MTLEFGGAGEVNGSSGCNTFFGSYSVSASDIAISQLSSTSLLCAEPEGIMEQEAAYVAALQSATTYRIDGNSLELRSGDQIAAILNRVQ